MFGSQGFGCFQLNDQITLHQQIDEVVTDDGAVLVIDFDRMLLFHHQPCLRQSVRQSILVNLLQVPVGMIDMDVIGDLPYLVG